MNWNAIKFIFAVVLLFLSLGTAFYGLINNSVSTIWVGVVLAWTATALIYMVKKL